MLGWAQTSLGHGEDDTGRLVHEISCESANVILSWLRSALERTEDHDSLEWARLDSMSDETRGSAVSAALVGRGLKMAKPKSFTLATDGKI